MNYAAANLHTPTPPERRPAPPANQSLEPESNCREQIAGLEKDVMFAFEAFERLRQQISPVLLEGDVIHSESVQQSQPKSMSPISTAIAHNREKLKSLHREIETVIRLVDC
jgi:hypothetical protein